MNECKNIQPLLSEYIDGALSGDDAWRVRMHLASCAVCERVADELSATASLLRALPRPETTAGFEAALARRLAAEALPVRRPSPADALRDWWSARKSPFAVPALAAAAALAAVGGIWVSSRPVGSPAAPERAPVAPVARTSDPATAVAAAPANKKRQRFLEQCLEEHASYASAEPLGDQAVVILASSPAAGGR